jgi:phosphatidylserine synthase
LAFILTSLNLLIGLLLCVGVVPVSDSLPWVVFAVVLDGTDGCIARRAQSSTRTRIAGRIADSVADSVTFGIFPAIALAQTVRALGFDSSPLALLPVLYVCLALSREVRTVRNANGFRGLPNTLAALVTVSYLVQLAAPRLEYLVLPAIAMALPITIPSLRQLERRASVVYVPFAGFALSLIPVIAPHVTITILNLVTLLYFLGLAMHLSLSVIAAAGIVLYTNLVPFHGDGTMPSWPPAVYRFFVRDSLSLLLLSCRVLYPRDRILIILGRHLGGILAGSVLRILGYQVFHVSDAPITWRPAFHVARRFDYVFVSADGPFGPYGSAKLGARKLADYACLPLLEVGIDAPGSAVVHGLRGGLHAPFPWTATTVSTKPVLEAHHVRRAHAPPRGHALDRTPNSIPCPVC